jgi:hypothetical protein
MAERYQPSEQDIEKTIRWLKIHDPKKADPEDAAALLRDIQAGAHMLGHSSPELLEKLYEELQKGHRPKTED